MTAGSRLRPGQPRWGGPGGGWRGVKDAPGGRRCGSAAAAEPLGGFCGRGMGWKGGLCPRPSRRPGVGGLSLRPGRCPRLASASGPSPQLQEDEWSHRAPAAGGRSEPGAPGIPPHLAALQAPFSRLGAHVPACCMGPCPLSGPLPLLGPDTPPAAGPEVKVRRGPARPWGLVRLLPHSLASVKLPRALAAP